MFQTSEKFSSELQKLGLSSDHYEKAVNWLHSNGFHETGDINATGEWFFASQFFFILSAMNPMFSSSPISAKKDSYNETVTPLVYFLILYSESEVVPEAISIALSGDLPDEDNGGLDNLLEGIFGKNFYTSAWRSAESFLHAARKHTSREQISLFSGMPTLKLMGHLRRLKIPLSLFLQANKNHIAFKDGGNDRIRKMGMYWEPLFFALSDPTGIKKEGEGQKTLVLAQGNLENLVFLMFHYTLLWKRKQDLNEDPSSFFRDEIKAMSILLKKDDIPFPSSIEGIYLLLKEVYSPSIFAEALGRLSSALEFYKAEQK